MTTKIKPRESTAIKDLQKRKEEREEINAEIKKTGKKTSSCNNGGRFKRSSKVK